MKMIQIPEPEKTILISKGQFAEIASLCSAMLAGEFENPLESLKSIRASSRLLGLITSALFDDDEKEEEQSNEQ